MDGCSFEVTIGIPVYDVERYVERALLSALEQDFRYPFEILVVDDCGTDGSMDIIRRLADTHKRGGIIRIISHKSNCGVGQAKDTIISNAKGRYLFFLDPDDWITPDTLSVLYDRAIKTGADITVGGIVCSYTDGSTIPYRTHPDITLFHEHAGIKLQIVDKIKIHGEMCAKLWLSSFLHKLQIKCTHRIFEETILDFVSNIESSSICLTAKPVYYYRYGREGSILTESVPKGTDETVLTMASIINSMRALIREKYMSVPGVFDLYFQKVRNFYRLMLRMNTSKEQRSFFNAQVHGCISTVPSVWSLRTFNSKVMYLICRKRDTVEQYLKYHRIALTFSNMASSLKTLFQ